MKLKKHKGFPYASFDQINGEHPLKNSVDGGSITYQTRIRKNGHVTYFNFPLAKEMGLLDSDHPANLNSLLEEKILETFSLVIINEYDINHGFIFPEEEIKENKFMATRYLQLQHPSKIGKTSGDGRSIWNGIFQNRGAIWDISSCGTGATCLSPATAKENKFFQTGDPSISYGCGYCEADEGLESLIMSEIFLKNNIKSERVLAIITFEDNISITVRAHKNLLRPSHIFLHLKQSNHHSLKQIIDYYIKRQIQNKEWHIGPKKKYDFFLEKMIENFAFMAADFESYYIFCWMDWDGDNILMDGSIIDYGSVRQFGLFHHQYRFDDVDRYSTTIIEQKRKVRYIVQSFAQCVKFLKTGKKRPLSSFSKKDATKKFDRLFNLRMKENLLKMIGLRDEQIQYLLNEKKSLVESFQNAYRYFERAKSLAGPFEVADGINWSAIFCMRDMLRELPQIYLTKGLCYISDEDFLSILKSSYALPEDLRINLYRKNKIKLFQKNYQKILKELMKFEQVEIETILLEICMRSSVINRYDRITGNSITHIVHSIIKENLHEKPDRLYEVVNEFVNLQILDPDYKRENKKNKQDRFVNSMLKIVKNHREGL